MLAWILERWCKWSDNGGDIETVFSRGDLLTHATIYWVTNTIGTSIRLYANHNRYPWTPSHDRLPVVQAPQASLSSATRIHPASGPPTVSNTSAPVTVPSGTTTSTSPPTPTAATSFPGKSPSAGPAIYAAPSRGGADTVAGTNRPTRPAEYFDSRYGRLCCEGDQGRLKQARALFAEYSVTAGVVEVSRRSRGGVAGRGADAGHRCRSEDPAAGMGVLAVPCSLRHLLRHGVYRSDPPRTVPAQLDPTRSC